MAIEGVKPAQSWLSRLKWRIQNAVEKKSHVETAKTELRDLMFRRAIWPNSLMMLPFPELVEPETGRPISAILTNQVYQRLQTKYGENERFITAFGQLFKDQPLETIITALSAVRQVFEMAERHGPHARRLIPLLYTMLTDDDYDSSTLGQPKKFIDTLLKISDQIEAGKDPIKAMDFDSYLVEVIRKYSLIEVCRFLGGE